MQDRGIWITWYDLPEQNREAYFEWLHHRYIPRVLERQGCLWAAHYEAVVKGDVRMHTDDTTVPGGTKFLLLFGAEYADVFGKPTPARFHAQLSAEDRQMLALHLGRDWGREARPVCPGQARVEVPERLQEAAVGRIRTAVCPWRGRV